MSKTAASSSPAAVLGTLLQVQCFLFGGTGQRQIPALTMQQVHSADLMGHCLTKQVLLTRLEIQQRTDQAKCKHLGACVLWEVVGNKGTNM